MFTLKGVMILFFWEIVFEKLCDLKIKILEVGGKNEIRKHIDSVLRGELNSIVACDADLSPITGKLIDHPKLIVTAGYSIENSLVTDRLLSKIAKRMGRLGPHDIDSEYFRNWLDRFCERLSSFVINDVINEIDELGISVVPDSCERFFTSQNSSELCELKISEHMEGLKLSPEPDVPALISSKLEDGLCVFSEFIRGHFLISAAQRCVMIAIKNIRGKISISKDAFFGAACLAFESDFSPAHKHYCHYKNSIDRLLTFPLDQGGEGARPKRARALSGGHEHVGKS